MNLTNKQIHDKINEAWKAELQKWNDEGFNLDEEIRKLQEPTQKRTEGIMTTGFGS